MDYDLDLLDPVSAEQFQAARRLGVPVIGLDRLYQMYLLLNQIPEENWASDETISLINEGELNG